MQSGVDHRTIVYMCGLQSVDHEEPIKVDPAPKHSGPENGHTAHAGQSRVPGVQVVPVF